MTDIVENEKGRAVAFATLTPFSSRLCALAERVLLFLVRNIPEPEERMKALEFLHHAFWVGVPRRMFPAKTRASQHGALLFMSAYNRDLKDYLRGFTENLRTEMNDLWNKCEKWPGADDYRGTLEFILKYQRYSNVFYNAYDRGDVRGIRQALELRKQLDELAVKCQGEGKPTRGHAGHQAFSDEDFEKAYRDAAITSWGG